MNRLVRPMVLAAGMLVASSAFADDAHVFEDGTVHFSHDEGLLVSTTQVRAPEGPVDVITVQPIDPMTGVVVASSFVSFTVFHAPIDLPSLAGESEPEKALEVVLAGIGDAFPPEAGINPVVRTYAFAGQDAHGAEFSITLDGVTAEVRAGAVEADGATVVFYDHRVPRDAGAFARFDTVIESFGFGDAPDDEDGDTEDEVIADDEAEEEAE